MRCRRLTACRVQVNEYGPCVACDPLPTKALRRWIQLVMGNGSQATHPTRGRQASYPMEMARRLAWRPALRLQPGGPVQPTRRRGCGLPGRAPRPSVALGSPPPVAARPATRQWPWALPLTRAEPMATQGNLEAPIVRPHCPPHRGHVEYPVVRARPTSGRRPVNIDVFELKSLVVLTYKGWKNDRRTAR